MNRGDKYPRIGFLVNDGVHCQRQSIVGVIRELTFIPLMY